jgi:hypothetical protein
MSVDRHGVWRRLRWKLATLEQRAPSGWGVKIEVYLIGREDPIQLGTVDTSRAKDEPFTWIQAAGSVLASSDPDSRMPHPEGEWILVADAHVSRIEVRYVPEIEAPPRVEFVEDEPPASNE